jgi:alpha-glucosidase
MTASGADFQQLPDGISLQAGSDNVEIRVASPHAFRLHVLPGGGTASPRSIFLSDSTPKPAAFTVDQDAASVGIKTAFGELKVDRKGGRFQVSDASGKPITDWSPWSLAAAGASAKSTLDWVPAQAPAAGPLYYGSGSYPHLGDLVETESPGQTGNGWASLPQFWSTAGCGSLLISAKDDAPASWKSRAGGKVDWTIPGPSIDFYVMPGATLNDWVRDQAELTGFAPVPPKWALGYMQSRWGWKDKAYIDDTLKHFHDDHLPVDVFIFDFEWYTKTPDYSVPPEGKPDFIDFDWNPTLFPDPVGQLNDFAQQGLQMVGIRKPRLGNSALLEMARGKGWILPPNPGEATEQRNLDFTNPGLRAWYGDQLQKFDEQGVAGFWNDEGELRYDEYSYWTLAQYDLLKRVKADARYWSINRAFAPGMQRTGAATWSGDTPAVWDTLQKTPGQLLSYGFSGMPYSACDIGGFNGTPTPELLARWMEAGVFFPIYRSHSEISQTPRFPWLYGEDTENAIRTALDLRYRLVPYYYSLEHETYRAGMPMMRPLVMEFPGDAQAANKADEWLMGTGLLAAPVMQEGGARSVYLPADHWYVFGTNQALDGPQTVQRTAKLDEVPMYVRAGTILPLGPVIQHTSEESSEPLEVQIYPGHDGSFDLVDDDGKTLGYQTGAVRTIHFTWNDKTHTLSWKTAGSYSDANGFHALHLVFFGPSGQEAKDAEFSASDSVQFSGK